MCLLNYLLNNFSTTYIIEVKHCCFGSSCLKQTGFQAQVDSGTSFTYLPYEIYGKVVICELDPLYLVRYSELSHLSQRLVAKSSIDDQLYAL